MTENNNSTTRPIKSRRVNDFEIPPLTMSESLQKMSRERPDEIALSYYGTNFTYTELQSEIDTCTRAMVASGIKEGDVLALCLPNLPAAIIAFYAANSLGCICNMIHPLSPPRLVEKHLEQTNSIALFIADIAVNKLRPLLDSLRSSQQIKALVVCGMADHAPFWKRPFFKFQLRKNKPEKALLQGTSSWNKFMQKAAPGGEIPQRSRDHKSVCTYLHSGGTTADPKTIKLSDYNFNAIAYQGLQMLGYPLMDEPKYGKSMITVLPLFHGFGLCIGMHTCLINDIRVHLLPRFSAQAIAEMFKKYKANYLCGVPTLYEALLKSEEMQGLDLSSLEAAFCGGDSLTPELKERFDNFLAERSSPARLREGYGLTETVTVCSVMPEEYADKNGIGLPLANIKMKIIDTESRQTLPPNEIGEICVSGPTTMLGYLNDEEASAHAVVKHADGLDWVETGDIGYQDEEGFFHFKGRLKRTLKVSGIPVFPKEIEELISSLEQVRYVAAIGIPHPYKMSVVKVFVVAHEGADLEQLEAEIMRICKQSLITHAVPQEIEFREHLPQTLIGKIDIKALEQEETERSNNS